MTGAVIGTDLSAASATASHGLGDRHTDHEGKEYVYVQADGAISATDVLQLTEAYQAEHIDTTTSDGAFGDLVAVANHDFADDEFGWVQVKGPTTVNVATSAAANTELNTTGTAGRLDDDATTGAEVIIGLATTAAESGNEAAAVLNYPSVGATL